MPEGHDVQRGTGNPARAARPACALLLPLARVCLRQNRHDWVDSRSANYLAVVIFWQWGWLGCLLSALRACAPPGWRLAKNMYEDWRRVTSQRMRTMVHHIRTQLQYAKANPDVLFSYHSYFFSGHALRRLSVNLTLVIQRVVSVRNTRSRADI